MSPRGVYLLAQSAKATITRDTGVRGHGTTVSYQSDDVAEVIHYHE